jgi:hypothetical protein
MKLPQISKQTIVRVLTVVLTPVVTILSAWLAKDGINLNPSTVVVVAALAGASVLAVGFHWLQRQPLILDGEKDLDTLAAKVAAYSKSDPEVELAINHLWDGLSTQRDEILAAIEKTLHVPVSADAVVAQLIKQAASAEKTPEPEVVEEKKTLLYDQGIADKSCAHCGASGGSHFPNCPVIAEPDSRVQPASDVPVLLSSETPATPSPDQPTQEVPK